LSSTNDRIDSTYSKKRNLEDNEPPDSQKLQRIQKTEPMEAFETEKNNIEEILITDDKEETMTIPSQFNTWMFWKIPLPQIQIDESVKQSKRKRDDT